MPVIVLLSEPTPSLVQGIMRAGADDVVMKPVSTKGLLERIHLQIHRRKPFIVTDAYAGPARKVDDASWAIAPPNPLYEKAMGEQVKFHDVERGIQNALIEVKNRRPENTAPEIVALLGCIVPMLDKGVVSKAALGGLQMLIKLNQDLMGHMAGSKYDHVSELCWAMITVSETLSADVGSPPE